MIRGEQAIQGDQENGPKIVFVVVWILILKRLHLHFHEKYENIIKIRRSSIHKVNHEWTLNKSRISSWTPWVSGSSNRSVCVFDVPFHVVYFEAYFAPTSRSQMSKIFRYSESLGKKCRKEVVSELNIFVGMWSKIAA